MQGFDSSAAIGTFVPVEHYKDIQNLDFHLLIDGKEVQRGCTADMLFKIDDIIAYVSQFVTLKIGDLLFTGTPVGVGPVSIGQRLQGYLEEKNCWISIFVDLFYSLVLICYIKYEDKSRLWFRRTSVGRRS